MTAKEIIYSLPNRLKKDEVSPDEKGTFHFDISGPDGGEFSVHLENGECRVEDGFHGVPDCIVKAKDSTYAKIETGQLNPQMAFMMGQIKISNIGAMMKFIGLFAKA